jgi:hypothetical protein
MQQLPGAFPSMTPLERAIELTYPASTRALPRVELAIAQPLLLELHRILARRRVQVRLKPLRLQEIAILRLRTLLSTPGFCRRSRIRAACAPASQSASHTRSSRPEARTAAIATRIEMIRSFKTSLAA